MDDAAGIDSGHPAAPEWRLRFLAEFACPTCSYDLTHNPVPRCPECGYSLQADDIRYTEHRKLFLDLTRAAPYLRHGIATLFILVSFPFFGFMVALPPMLSVLFLSVGRGRGQVSRLRRRIWVMSTLWLQIPWVVVGMASSVYDWLYWRSSFFYSMNLADELLDWNEVLLFTLAVSVYAGGLWMWRRSLRRLAEKVALGIDDPVLRWNSAATRVAMLSYGLACLLMIVPVLMWTMDTFWPGWA